LEILEVYDFECTESTYLLNGKALDITDLEIIANNDGLTLDQFECWFDKKEFSGQVICWSKVWYNTSILRY
jgi:hypothetical protein